MRESLVRNAPTSDTLDHNIPTSFHAGRRFDRPNKEQTPRKLLKLAPNSVNNIY